MSLINIEKTIELDVYDHDTTPSVIKAIQLDEGTRAVYAVIQNSRQGYDIGQNAEVKLTVLRPDKTRVQITGQTFGYNGTDGTIYGAKAELSDVALAVKGNLKAQFKITSGDQELRTEIFTINNGEALDAGDGDWAGDLDGHNLDEMAQDIEDAKAAVSEMETDVSELKSGFNELYNTAYVTDSASGSIAHFVDGADNVPMKSVVIDTESSSATVTRTGKNLLKPLTFSTSVHNGISFTYTSDGRIVCNGTSTGIAYSAAQNGFRLPVGQYVKNTQDINGIGIIVQTKTSPDWTNVQGGGVSDRTVTISAEDTLYDLAVRIRIPSGVTLNNYVYYPMLRLASDTDDTYEPYNGNTYEVTLVDGVVQEEIKSLLGINNVWSDAGDVNVEYRADTKLYIKRLTDSDTDMIADANIVSGQYFMVGNDLYRATVNIASGAQVIEGTNATKVSLSEALNQIKEA